MMALKRAERAFSLVELLTVAALVSVLAAVGVVSLQHSGATGARSGAEFLHSLFGQARSQAVMERSATRVVVQKQYNPSAPDDFLRNVAVLVADSNDPTGWRWLTSWRRLPEGAFFDEEQSTPDGEMLVQIAGRGGSCGYYEFQANGQRPGTARAIVSEGRVTTGTFTRRDDKARYGFVVYPMGQLAFLSTEKAPQKP